MILTREKRVEALILMNTYGFTYTELDKMKPAELDMWIEASYILQESFLQNQTEEMADSCCGKCSE